ncbi:hypothetical protein ACFL0B_05235 [Thermodesulfobacteriota bacterium]
MKIRVDEIDTKIMGRVVLSILDFSPKQDFTAFEKAYIEEYDPQYVYSKVPIEKLESINSLERHGFRFIEVQMKLTHRMRKPHDTSSFPYRFEHIEKKEDLEEVLKIARETFDDDRITIDTELLDAKTLAVKRYEAYLLNSFNDPDERVSRLVNLKTKEVVAFSSHRILGNGEVQLFLGGVKPKYKGLGLAPLHSMCQRNSLIDEGVKKITTHISARNYDIINLEVGGFKYKVEQSFVVLRKLY